MQLSSPHCVTRKKLLLTYQIYAASQFFVRALFDLEIYIDRNTLKAERDVTYS